jgi:YbbR domain-containing protein
VIRMLFDNLPLKAVSLVVAVLMWFVIAGEKTSERGLLVPVELQNLPKDLELTGEVIHSVEVRLRASPGIIHGLGPRDVSALVDLRAVTEGERIVHLTAETIRTPFGVKVVKVTPSLLILNFERTLEKEVPVRPRLVGQPAPGRQVAEIRSDPPQVRIVGPRTRVERVESAFTEPVSVANASQSVTATVSIGLEDAMLRLVSASKVNVSVRIAEEQGRRTLEGLPIGVRGGTAQVSPRVTRVVLSGPQSVLKSVDRSLVLPYVTVGAEGATRAAVSVELKGLPGLTVVETIPAQVTIRETRRPR